MVTTRAQVIVAAVMMTVGTALVLWAVVGDAYDKLLTYAYDDGVYLRLVADHDAVGARVHRLDVVRGSVVASYSVELGPDAQPTLSVRDGLACVVGECRRVAE